MRGIASLRNVDDLVPDRYGLYRYAPCFIGLRRRDTPTSVSGVGMREFVMDWPPNPRGRCLRVLSRRVCAFLSNNPRPRFSVSLAFWRPRSRPCPTWPTACAVIAERCGRSRSACRPKPAVGDELHRVLFHARAAGHTATTRASPLSISRTRRCVSLTSFMTPRVAHPLTTSQNVPAQFDHAFSLVTREDNARACAGRLHRVAGARRSRSV